MGKIGPVSILDNNVLKSSTGIVLINAHKRPPHLAVYSNGRYFSLSANEVQNSLDLTVMLHVINRKKIPSIFISFKKTLNNSLVEKIFASYSDLNQGMTCINPIKKLVNQQVCEINNVQFVFELIPFLEKSNHLKSYHHLYCESYLDANYFELREYSMEDILTRIKNLVK
jgi:hypothetical protein